MIDLRDDPWRRRCQASTFREAVSFCDDELVLGLGTVLRKLGEEDLGRISLNGDAAYNRMIALLAVAGRGNLAKAALTQLAAAVDDWLRGDRGLAAIRLAFAPLPRLRDQADSHRLYLAERALDTGLSPNDLLRELAYPACAALLKFDPNQPRVPAGSGDRSGQWTSGETGSGASNGATSASSVRAVPVLFSGQPDAEEHRSAEDPWWRLDMGGNEKTRIEEGQPILPPTVAPGAQAAPTVPPARAPSVTLPDAGPTSMGNPSPAMGPAPLLIPAPAGAPTPSDPTPDPRDENGSACPAPQKDRPHGSNPKSEEFEYSMSLRINPNDPTPKYSAATPDVASQAYYLPSPTPDGKTSFDDCKKDDTPTDLPIPDLEPGAMFEHKAGDWGWQLFYPHATGFSGIERQVESPNAAVVAEGRERQIYYCLDNQRVASQASAVFKDYPNSHFLVCH